MTEHMLTTIDNPYSPVTEFDLWLAFDSAKGYNTLGLLDRVLVTSDELSEADQSAAIEDAINVIVDLNPLGIHKKIEVS